MSPRLYNALTVLTLGLTALFAAWAALVFANPASALNPLKPMDELPMVAQLPTSVAVTRLFTSTPLPPTPTRPTATPLPPPSRTPTSLPTVAPTVPTATEAPTVAPVSAPIQASPQDTTVAANIPLPTATFIPPPPQSTGGFELGGQVADFNHADQMKYAGMAWVKRQLRWGPGANPNDANGFITDAHAKGFKILLSVLGDPESIRGGANYGDYASYVGGVAALGADAIEVWNEMNIDREWPGGEISGASYTQLLKQAYSAIKAGHPATMVISGAPAPTGYFGGCSTAGCDDKPYVEAMAAAGATSYMDCMGVHYNEGIVPPGQTSGDPRGSSGYYTRYYQSMISTYYTAEGGRRKLCFTELGYLTGEGYSPPLAEVAPGFGWAGNTTVSQQAQWLADAARMAQSDSRVRLIVVFNVDFTGWGQDPQGGYAIIRPGGGCPACEALHGVGK
ncbi:MAG: hypothetical protein HYZ35_07525 [Chloroflexi bacterium]|nr:hypothetical protein [Chloroflexota bacterium]